MINKCSLALLVLVLVGTGIGTVVASNATVINSENVALRCGARRC